MAMSYVQPDPTEAVAIGALKRHASLGEAHHNRCSLALCLD